jgi:uncharacterized SAM-binding protein YcdF (DUF218 family)
MMEASRHDLRPGVAQRRGNFAGNSEEITNHSLIGSHVDPRSRRFWGILTREQRWGISIRGWFVLVVIGFVSFALLLLNTYPFLAITDRVNANVLVVEGWVHPYAIRAAVKEFKTGGYRRIFTTGGPVVGRGGYVNDYQTAASVGADLLKKDGIPGEVVQMVPTRVMGRDRTYSSAVALRDWLLEHNLQVRSLNIVTEGAHARRTRLLFEEALGRDVNVGVISVPSPDFDATRWWYYSEALEDVVGEGLGYLYAKFFYYPRESEPAPQKNAIRNGSPPAGSALSD